jgi:hypothetical protein
MSKVRVMERGPVWETRIELGASTNVLYARSSHGRLYRWNPVTGEAKLFNQEGFVALAPDGSLAVTHRKLEARGSRVMVEALSEILRRLERFEKGGVTCLRSPGSQWQWPMARIART